MIGGRPGPAPKVRRLATWRRTHSDLSTASGMLAGFMESDHFRTQSSISPSSYKRICMQDAGRIRDGFCLDLASSKETIVCVAVNWQASSDSVLACSVYLPLLLAN